MLKIINTKFAEREEFLSLAKSIEEGAIPCEKVYHQNDGDVRYWNIDVKSNTLLEKLSDLAKELYQKQIGAAPHSIIGMFNTIDASRSPNGSGGGWHRDSIHAQFKMFVLLSDVNNIANGAFVVYPRTSSLWFKVLTLPLIIWGMKRRFPDSVEKSLDSFGFEKHYFIGNAGSLAFCDTSAIHRGSPIKDGCRQMISFYLYKDTPSHPDMR